MLPSRTSGRKDATPARCNGERRNPERKHPPPGYGETTSRVKSYVLLQHLSQKSVGVRCCCYRWMGVHCYCGMFEGREKGETSYGDSEIPHLKGRDNYEGTRNIRSKHRIILRSTGEISPSSDLSSTHPSAGEIIPSPSRFTRSAITSGACQPMLPTCPPAEDDED